MMKFGRYLLAALVAASFVSLAAAQGPPSRLAPRLFPSQQVHYTRITVAYNSCVPPPGATACSIRVGALPYNAFITNGWQQGIVTFDGTAPTVNIGTAQNGAQLVAGAAVTTAGPGTAATIVASAIGQNITGNGIPQTGGNGGFDIWLTLSGGTGGTMGLGVVIIEWIAPNDGLCRAVPLGQTAPGC